MGHTPDIYRDLKRKYWSQLTMLEQHGFIPWPLDIHYKMVGDDTVRWLAHPCKLDQFRLGYKWPGYSWHMMDREWGMDFFSNLRMILLTEWTE